MFCYLNSKKVVVLNMSKVLKILDLGCGNKKREGATGVDYNDRTAADIVHNLNEFPYPFEDNSIDKIYLWRVVCASPRRATGAVNDPPKQGEPFKKGKSRKS